MDQRPIGVFDSGLGGLTAVREMRRLMPSENIIYFGDTSRVPYGGRSPEILLKYARQDVHFLRSFDIKAVLVACGTVSTTALPQLQAENDLPILGVVEPACRKAAAMTRNRRVGLIATAASVRSGAYERTLHRLDETIHVVSRACPLLVPLVENGRYQPGDVVIETVAREYLEPLRQEGLDVLILGCTHYPLLTDIIREIMGPEVSLVNAMSRETILRQYLDTLKGQYSHILIDCQPSLGMLTVNALAAANRVIIPVQAEYLPAKGLEQLLQTVNKVKRQINPKLQIDGILLTMVDNRTNFAKEIAALLRETYGSKIKVFGTEIPHSVRAKEISAEGKSIFAHDPNGKVAEGYKNLTKEVIKLEKQREKSRAGSIR